MALFGFTHHVFKARFELRGKRNSQESRIEKVGLLLVGSKHVYTKKYYFFSDPEGVSFSVLLKI